MIAQGRLVAPSTEAWIEIHLVVSLKWVGAVAPSTGAWIEIPWEGIPSNWQDRRSLHGSVD